MLKLSAPSTPQPAAPASDVSKVTLKLSNVLPKFLTEGVHPRDAVSSTSSHPLSTYSLPEPVELNAKLSATLASRVTNW